MKRLLILLILLLVPVSGYAQQRLRYQTATTIRIGPFKKLSDNTLDGAQNVSNFQVTVIPHSDSLGVTAISFNPTGATAAHVVSSSESGMYELVVPVTWVSTLGRMDVVTTTLGTACQPILNQFTVVGMDEFDRAEGGDGSTIADIFAQPTTSFITPGSFGTFLLAMLDVAVGTRFSGAAMTELTQAQPPATPTPDQAIMALYMALRNRLEVTNTSKRIFNGVGTVIFKKALSDDGTTFSEAQATSGP